MVRACRFVSLGERDVEQWLEHAALPLSLDERDMEQWLEHAALCRLEGGGAMVGSCRFVIVAW